MFRNYCVIILRNLWRNKLYTSVNIITLAIGIATIVWGFQDYRYSTSFEDFHKDGKNIFRVLTKPAGSDFLQGVCPGTLALVVKNDFPFVKEAVRWESRSLNVKAAQSEPFESKADFTSSEFFNVFNFPLVRGTNQVDDRSTVLITESAAKKYFGDADAIGKTLIFYSDEDYRMPLTVTGILKDPPFNSSIQFELITNTDNRLMSDGSTIKKNDWARFSDAVFVKLSIPADRTKLSNGLQKYIPLEQSARLDMKIASFYLQPLAQISNAFDIANNPLYGRPSDSATYGPLVLAILILLSACLNFANTSVAQSNRRLKEMGVRKVMGSGIRQIILQQLLECSIIVLLAIALSVIINNFWLPKFNSMFNGVNVTAHYLTDYTLFAFLAAVFAGVSLLAGAYPAFYISRFNAANIFRGSVKFGGSNLFSRILLGFQIAISLITVIAGVAFSRNSKFQSNYDYGYEKANVIGLDLQNGTSYTAVRDQISKIPGVDKTAGTIHNIGFSYYRVPMQANGQKNESIYLEIGENYIDLMKLKLAAGRNLSTAGNGDFGKSMLINEKLAFQFGWNPRQAIGQQIKTSDSTSSTVVGVLKDFAQNTLFDPIQPVAMVLVSPEKYARIIIRAKPGSLNTVFAETKAAWAKLYPMKPFRGSYQDEIGAQASSVNESIAIIFSWFAIISIFIAATSMFALVSLNVLKRSKEIAIRKVVGAADRHIFQLVMKGYFWIFLLSAGVGCYGGYALSKLLMDLIFRINAGVSPSSLAISFIAVFLICTITIGARVWIVLRTKATEALKAS
jgi:ABC-type antimicrobial peptide transport system permease subunit